MKSLSAVVVAAGRSQRFNARQSSGRLSKQLVEWGSKPLFIHTLNALSVLPVEELALVVRPEEEGDIHREVSKSKFPFSLKICFGGIRRQDSVRNGLGALTSCRRVFVHDAARPFCSDIFLKNLYAAAQSEVALIPGLEVVETLKEVDLEQNVIKTHDRRAFVRIQTPQFFDYSILRDVHERLKDSEIEFTDDAAMLERSGYPVKVYPGDPQNIKVTLLQDIAHLISKESANG